jgi:ribokinase
VRILNFGSLNIDHVYSVEHIARPGETLTSSTYQVFAGGKGANQSAALGRAGAPVYHAGLLGSDGAWLIDKLTSSGVDMRFTEEAEEGVTGHAVIQVEENGGQNSIVLYPGCNHAISQARISDVLEEFGEGDILLLQNEISEIPYLIEQGSARDMLVCFNPAPMTPAVLDYPLDQVDLLIVNQTEAAALGASVEAPRESRTELRPAPPGSAPRARRTQSFSPPAHDQTSGQYHRPVPVLLTLGEKGAIYRGAGAELTVEAAPATVVDTTGAGDTFIGYFIACVAQGLPAAKALRRAAAAAALSVSRAGAMDSIPLLDEVIRHEHYQESVT